MSSCEAKSRRSTSAFGGLLVTFICFTIIKSVLIITYC